MICIFLTLFLIMLATLELIWYWLHNKCKDFAYHHLYRDQVFNCIIKNTPGETTNKSTKVYKETSSSYMKLYTSQFLSGFGWVGCFNHCLYSEVAAYSSTKIGFTKFVKHKRYPKKRKTLWRIKEKLVQRKSPTMNY